MMENLYYLCHITLEQWLQISNRFFYLHKQIQYIMISCVDILLITNIWARNTDLMEINEEENNTVIFVIMDPIFM